MGILSVLRETNSVGEFVARMRKAVQYRLKQFAHLSVEIIFTVLVIVLRPFLRLKGFRRLRMRKGDKPKIVHYSEVPAGGGVTNYMVQLAKGLHRKGYAQVVVCLKPYGVRAEFAPLTDLGIPVIEVDLLRWPSFNLPKIRRLARVLRGQQADIFHCAQIHWYSSRTGLLAAALAGIPLITAIEEGGTELSHSRIQNWLKGMVFNTVVSKTIALSSPQVDALTTVFGVAEERITVIPNCVDVSEFKRDPQSSDRGDLSLCAKLGLTGDGPFIGTVARLHPGKGHLYLLEAAVQVVREIPTAQLLLAGDASLDPSFEQVLVKRCRSLGLDRHIKFCGHLEKQELLELYHLIDLSVLPSLYEGMSFAVLEAMAMEVPVVATSVYGMVDVVEDGVTGFLVPLRDSQALAQAILSLLKNLDRAREMGRAGRRRVEQFFTAEAVVEKTESLFQSLLDGREGTGDQL